MKIILSRKGFDASAGGYPSPVLPDGRLISLPIPDNDSIYRYSDLILDDDMNYFSLMKDLVFEIRFGKDWIQLRRDTRCHTDPDIYKYIIKRDNNWKGLFGQIEASQRHLENQSVGVNDLFLFFGWFKKTEKTNNQYCFIKDNSGEHIIFGYLQIGKIIKPRREIDLPNWMDGHPHLSKERIKNKTNALYVARERLSWDENIPGYGIFNYDESLILTKRGYSRSKWKLPLFFKNTHISYHNMDCWKEGHFQSACRGQEFVIQENENIIDWVKALIGKNVSQQQ